jgi:hypothetical protein
MERRNGAGTVKEPRAIDRNDFRKVIEGDVLQRDQEGGHYRAGSDSALIFGGALPGVIFLPCYLATPLAVSAVLWFLNGAGQAQIRFCYKSALPCIKQPIG